MSTRQAQQNNTVTYSGITGGTTLIGVDTRDLKTLSIIVDPTDNTGSPVTFTYVGSGNVVATGTANGLATGELVTLTTDGTLPTGVGTGTNYYVIENGTSVEFATSYAHAIAGTAIALSGTNTNEGTMTPTAGTYSMLVKAQNGSSNWFQLGSNTVTGGTSLTYTAVDPVYASLQLQFVVSAGNLAVNVSTCTKTDQF